MAICKKHLRFSCQQCSLHELCLPLALSEEEAVSLDDLIANQFIVKRNEILFHQGDSFRHFYVVRSGSFKYIQHHPVALDSRILAFYFTGDFFGLDAIADGHHPAKAIALEESSICAISFDSLLEVTLKVPKLQRYLFSIMSKQARQNLTHTVQHQSAEQRLVAFLLKLSRHFKERGYSATLFTLPMSRKDIANYLDLATETVSRLFANIQQRGLIAVDKKQITLLNVTALVKLVHPEMAAASL